MTLAFFVVLSFAACLAGGAAPGLGGLTQRVGASRVLALRSGLLIAVALLDVLPEAWEKSPALGALAAVGAFALGAWLHRGPEHEGHEHTHPHVHGSSPAAAVPALLLHSLMDGVSLGATALVGGPALLAAGTAIAFHKVADGFTFATLFPPRLDVRAAALLTLLALATPFGAVFASAGELILGSRLSALLLGYTGGSFLYVGAAQMLPRRSRDAASSASFGGGFAAMALLRRLF